MKEKPTAKVIVLLILSIVLLIGVSVILSVDRPVLSHGSGFYDEPFELEIKHAVAGAKIYYTTDGSIPNAASHLYTKPLVLSDTTDLPNQLSAITDIGPDPGYPTENVMKAHVIRVLAIMPWGTRTEVVQGTYFVGCDRKEHYGDVPVISLMMDPKDLFDYEAGIYVNGQTYDNWIARPEDYDALWFVEANYINRGIEWERKVTLEYLPAHDEEPFVQDMGIRIKGGVSRAKNQKSLRLIARKEYGNEAIDYPFFQDNKRLDGTGDVEGYKSITLRNGGSDWFYAKIRDPYIQNLAKGMRFITQDNKPCVVFINGEYWGLYTLNEEYSDDFFEYNYGIDKDNIISVKNYCVEHGFEGEDKRFWSMMEFIADNDMSDNTNYKMACKMLDMGSFTDYCALQLYICSDDGIFVDQVLYFDDKAIQGNNWQVWCTRVPEVDNSPYSDGKWRMMLFDTEWSSGLFGRSENANKDNITQFLLGKEPYAEYRFIHILRSLWCSEDFRKEMVQSLCDVRNIYFEKNRAAALMKEMRAEYEPLLPENYRRYGYDGDGAERAANELDALNGFFQQRYESFPGILQSALGLSEPVRVSVLSSDSEQGTVMLNHSVLDLSEGFTGEYFAEYPISLTAVPAEGSEFVGWEIEGAEIADPAQSCIEIEPQDGLRVTAVFQ